LKDHIVEFLSLTETGNQYLTILKCILIIGTFGLMHGAVIHALRKKDVTPVIHQIGSTEDQKGYNELLGYNVVISKSKTDQNGNGYLFFLPNQKFLEISHLQNLLKDTSLSLVKFIQN